MTPKLLAKISFMTLLIGTFFVLMRPDGHGDTGWEIGFFIFRVGLIGLLAAAVWAIVMHHDHRSGSKGSGHTQA